jgi:dihydrofolate reductase
LDRASFTEETAVRKLIEATLVSLDGIVGAQETWTSTYFDAESKDHALSALADVDTFLLGRVTYERFSARWPLIQGDKYFDRINSLKKLVASNTLRTVSWNATLIKGDIAAEIDRIKRQPGKDIMKYGTSQLDRTLVQHDLIDEFHLWYFPVVPALSEKPKRLFEDVDMSRVKLELADRRRFKNGTVLLTYLPRRKV